MNNVTLTIAGRNYTVACAPGEEAHIHYLGDMIREKLATLGAFSGQSEPRNLLFAALLLADEVHEARGEQPQAADKGAAGESAAGGQTGDAARDETVVHQLAAIAGQLENLATRLEGSAASP